MIKDAVYENLPHNLQNVLFSIYGYYWKKRRYGGDFEKYLDEFLSREFYDFHQWEEYQNFHLRRLLIHSFQYVPFYNQKFKEVGITLKDLDSFNVDNLNQLPLLEKEELRQYGKSTLMATNYDRKGDFLNSSGSTGSPVSIYYSHSFHQKWFAACEARMRYWAGIDYTLARGMIGGRQILGKQSTGSKLFYRYNAAEKQTYFSAYHISRKNAPYYLEGIVKNKVQYMTGYAVSNYLLAKHFKDLDLEVPKMRAVLTSSEKLTLEMRTTIEEVYQCKVFDAYSGVEACGLISESPEGELLFSPDTGIMEIKNTANGKTGELILTGLLNYDQPLIRYRIGDCVTISNKQSKCNRSMQVVKEIDGRVEDLIIGPNGSEMVRFHSLVYGIENIIVSQIVQHTRTDYVFNYESKSHLTLEEEKLIHSRLQYQLGDVNLIFNRKDKIELSKNSKFKSVISLVNE